MITACLNQLVLKQGTYAKAKSQFNWHINVQNVGICCCACMNVCMVLDFLGVLRLLLNMLTRRFSLYPGECCGKRFTHLVCVALNKLTEFYRVVLFKMVWQIGGVSRVSNLTHTYTAVYSFPVQYATISICIKAKVFPDFAFCPWMCDQIKARARRSRTFTLHWFLW